MSRPTLCTKVALAVSISLFALTGCSLRVSNSADDYLKHNYANINLNGDPTNQFRLLDDSLNRDVFLAGEQHAIRTNYDLQLALLKYFNQKAGVRYLLIEMGFSQSAYLNEYLSTGNEELLRKIFRDSKGTAGWSKESFEFWQRLREYNQTLPPDHKIKVIGIDIEFQIGTALDYLHSIIPNGDIPEQIQPTIAAFKGSKSSLNSPADVRELLELMQSLQKDIEQNQDTYNQYLGSKLFDFSIVVDNILNSINFQTNLDSTSKQQEAKTLREQSIYSNFKRVYGNLPKGKYFGQWGGEHVSQKSSGSILEKKFAIYLNAPDSPVKNKVLSIMYAYQYCFRMNWENHYEPIPAELLLNDIELLKDYTKTDVTMFKLNSKKSPYNNELHFVVEPSGGDTTQYFQYIILIRNSPAATPYGKTDPAAQ